MHALTGRRRPLGLHGIHQPACSPTSPGTLCAQSDQPHRRRRGGGGLDALAAQRPYQPPRRPPRRGGLVPGARRQRLPRPQAPPDLAHVHGRRHAHRPERHVMPPHLPCRRRRGGGWRHAARALGLVERAGVGGEAAGCSWALGARAALAPGEKQGRELEVVVLVVVVVGGARVLPLVGGDGENGDGR
uniref:Uncharacterized protein n=1 Tax=Arundo donax TaxID=35708 RepID=A0A0A9DS91_ARUDO